MEQRVSGRYAKTLLDLAAERGTLEEVKANIDSFREATENRDLYLLLKSPIVKPDKKKLILQTLFGSQFDELTMSFINIVVDKGREELLPDIASAFEEQYRKHNHISSVKLITAQPMSEAALNEIKSRVLNSTATDDKIEVEVSVNPDLIGGFILEFDNKRYDASIRSKLQGLKKEFKDNPYTPTFMARK